MHLTTTNPISGVWHQNTRAGVIPAISLTRLSRRNARISAHAMRMRAYARMRCKCAHFRACDANARISRMRCECSHMRAFPRMRCDAMRCECAHEMRCECAHQGGTYACPVLYTLNIPFVSPQCRVWTSVNTSPSCWSGSARPPWTKTLRPHLAPWWPVSTLACVSLARSVNGILLMSPRPSDAYMHL